jgi:flagellar basal-body rod protein FlgB
MKIVGGDMFTTSDKVKMEALNQRLARSQVTTANIANAEVPGYRAIGFDFEDQLQAMMGNEEGGEMKTNHPKHFKSEFLNADGTILPDVYVKPTESIPQDGNTVDVDKEMSVLAQDQLLYRSTVELINRKIAMLRYAISGGR